MKKLIGLLMLMLLFVGSTMATPVHIHQKNPNGQEQEFEDPNTWIEGIPPGENTIPHINYIGSLAVTKEITLAGLVLADDDMPKPCAATLNINAEVTISGDIIAGIYFNTVGLISVNQANLAVEGDIILAGVDGDAILRIDRGTVYHAGQLIRGYDYERDHYNCRVHLEGGGNYIPLAENIGDLNFNGIVDYADLVIFASSWLNESS